ncbi:MAG TPA: hypothetical protein VFV95_18180 [Vicinamibacterales bacterium]|nr:hypothetical protein [Vicinamibacterales bacterium]
MTIRHSTLARTFLLAAVVAGGHAVALRSALVVSRDMVTGDGSSSQLRPGFRYPLLRLPSNASTARYDAENRLGGDFAQIYFPAREFAAGTAYSEQTPDPWGRESRYPPFVHWACAVTICTLPYGQASLLHMAVQYAVFVLSFVYAFYALQLARYLPLALLFVNVGLFLTPVGLSWFERGQFSLYVAAAYLWLLLGVYRTNAVFLAVAALLAYAKWTSFPMLFVVLGIWLLVSPDRASLVRRARAVTAPVATIAGLFLLFPEQGMQFLSGVVSQESAFTPEGLSLSRVFPRLLVKLLPFGLVALGAYWMRRQKIEQLLPVVLGAAVLLLLYPTWAYDYSVPCLFGLIPFVLDWSRQVSVQNRLVAWAVPAIFLLFLTAASALKISDTLAAIDTDLWMIWVYIAVSAILLAAPLFRPAPQADGHI